MSARLVILFSALFLTFSGFGKSFNGNNYTLAITVDSPRSLYQAVDKANRRGGRTLIQLSPGIYRLPHTLRIKADYIALTSISGNPQNTILQGMGMRATPGVNNLLRVEGKHFWFYGLTGESAPNHIIQIVGEKDADNAIIEHCILQNAFEQILKVSIDTKAGISADNGIIRHCTFGYTTGIGPQYYIGGIDLHGGKKWLIESNQFFGIASPSKHIAEHAIHLWNGSQDNYVIDNLIINSDRGIGFGLSQRGNNAGVIKHNVIYHSNNQHRFADAGIILESSPHTKIEENWIFLYHDYQNAIEYRFKQTENLKITGNKTNRRIRQRDGATATLSDNLQTEKFPRELAPSLIDRFPPNYHKQVKKALSEQ